MITDTIKTDMVAAMKERNAEKVQTLRSVMAAFTNELVAHKLKPTDQLPDEDALAVVRRAVKQREEAREQFANAGRNELAEKEAREKMILETYLPQMMSQDEIRPIAEKEKEELGVTDKKDMGRLMGAVMGELKGKADGGDVKEVVESLLS